MKFNDGNGLQVGKPDRDVRAAIVIAHPDDETVWMGGTVLSKCDWQWKLLIATHEANDARGTELVSAVNLYKTQYGVGKIDYEFIHIMADTQDANAIDPAKTDESLNSVALSSYDIVFTHNTDGEDCHINHVVLGRYFRNKRKEGANIWHFVCPAIQNPRAKQVGEFTEAVFLSEETLKKKYNVFQAAYVSQEYLWTSFQDFMRFQFCSGIEMFTRF